MSHETTERTEDRLIAVISSWLARHLESDELKQRIEEDLADGLTPAQAEAVRELAEELGRKEPGKRAHLEMIARETVEVLALGE